MAHQYEKTDADTNNNILSPLWNTKYLCWQHLAVITKIWNELLIHSSWALVHYKGIIELLMVKRYVYRTPIEEEKRI